MQNNLRAELRYVKIIKYILYVLPVIIFFLVVLLYGYNIVFWDEYAFIRNYREILQGGNILELLFAQHNNHRLFFPRIIMYLTAYVSNYNTKIQMYISALSLTITYILYSKMVSERKLSEKSLDECITISVSGLILIGLCQYENLFWGMQVAWILIGTCITWAMYSWKKWSETGKNKYYVYIYIAATISCFSSLHGIATWLVLIVTIGITSIQRKQFLPKYVGIIIAAIVEIVLYLATYNQQHDAKKATDIMMTIKFFFMEIGSPIFDRDKTIQMIIGILLFLVVVVFFIAIYRRGLYDQYSDLFGIIIFSMGVAMMCAIGRSNDGNGVLDGVAPRYKTYQVMLLAALLIIVFKYCINKYHENKSYYTAGVIIMTVLATGCFLESIAMLNACRAFLSASKSNEKILLNYEDKNLDTLKVLYPFSSYEEAYDILDYMQQNRLSVFAKDIEKDFANVNIDTLNINISDENAVGFPGMSEIYWDTDYKVLTIGSWATDTLNCLAYSNILVKINEQYYRTNDHVKRQDVADAFNNQEYLYSGFEFSKNTRNLNTGINELNVVLISNNGTDAYMSDMVYIYKNDDGSLYFCDSNGTAITD